MKEKQLSNRVIHGYGTIPEVEMEEVQKDTHALSVDQSVFVNVASSRLYPPRAFSAVFIYVLTHGELITLPFLPILAYRKKQQEQLQLGHLLRGNTDGKANETIANILGKAALPTDLVSLLVGSGHVTEKFFPSILFGLLLHDVITFYTQVDNRYGTTLNAHLFGTASNALAWSSTYGTDMALETLHWLIPTIVGLALTVSAVSQCIYDRYRINAGKTTNAAIDTEMSIRCLGHTLLWDTNTENRHHALKRLGELSHASVSLMQRFRALSMIEHVASSFQPNHQYDGNLESLYGAALHTLSQRADNPEDSYSRNYARYLRWSLGEAASKKANFWLLPFALITLAIVFAKMRLIEMWWRKAKELADYRAAKKSCEQENKVYTLTQSGRVECTVCGDWPFMYYGDVFTSQACITGLLAYPREATFIVTQLAAIQERLNRHADFSVIDLSQQNWTKDWAKAEWNQFYTVFEAIPHLHVSLFNLSAPTLNPYRVTHFAMQRLAKFMQRVPIDALDVSGQDLSFDNFHALLAGFVNNTALKDFRFANTHSGDLAACDLAEILPDINISTLVTGYNNVSDAGMACYTEVLPKTEIHSFYVPGNPITESGMLPFVSNLSKTKVRHLDISGIPLTLNTMDSLAKQLNFLSSLYFSNGQVQDKHMRNWPTYAANSTIEVYDFSSNFLTGKSLIPFLVNLPTNRQLSINLAGLVGLNTHDYQQIGRLLPTKNFHALNISSTKLTCVGFAALTANTSQLHTLIAAKNEITDTCMLAFSQGLTDQSNFLRRLDLSNNDISSSGASQLLARVSETRLRVLNLAGNQLIGSEFGDYPHQIADSQLTELSLAQNPIVSEWLPQLLRALLINTSLQQLDLSGVALTEVNGLLLAQHLLPSIPHPDSLSDATLTRDQQRWLHDIQTSNHSETHISELRLRNTQLGEKGIRALCHAAPVAHLAMFELSGNVINSAIENIHDCSEIVAPPSSMAMQPLGTFANATRYHAASLLPTVLIAGTLLAWSVKKLLSHWLRNSSSIVEGGNTETLVTTSFHPSG